MNEEGFQKTEYALWAGMLLLTVLVGLKGIVGFQAHSDALLAAAAQSAAGICVLGAIMIRLRTTKAQLTGASTRGLDKPISMGSILLAVLIMVIGMEMGILSIKSWINHVASETNMFTLAVLVLSLCTKELMYLYMNRLGKQFGTEEFISNARRHRSDIYSSFVVLIGLLSTMLSESLGYSTLSYVDPLVGILIALLICKMGFNLISKTLSASAINVLHQEEAADFLAVVQRIHGVITVDDLCAREHGHYVVIEMTISVNPKLSVWEGHEVSKKIKQQLMKQYHHVTKVFIHVNPYDAGYPYKQQADVEASELPSVLH